MSAFHDLDALLAAIDQAVHVPTPDQPTKVTAPALNAVLRLLATELVGRTAAGGAAGVLTAPGGRTYRLQATDAGRLLLVPADGGLDEQVATFCALGGLTDEAQQQALNNLVISLKNNNVWDHLHALYPMVGGTAQAHALNLKNPADTDEAFRLTFYGAPRHSNLGVSWNGADQYATTHYLPQEHLLLTSTHLGYYTTVDDTSSIQVEMGCSDGNTFFSLLTHLNDHAYFENSEGGQVSAPVTTGLGFTLGTRERADQLALYRDGQQLASGAGGSRGFPPLPVHLGCRSQSCFSRKTCGLASIGTGLTPAQVQAYAAAVQVFQRALGRDAAVPT